MAEPAPPRLMVVEDDAPLRRNLVGWLAHEGYDVLGAADAEGAMALLAERPTDLVVIDHALPGMSGLDLLAAIRARDPELAVVFLSGQGTMDVAIAALRADGAYDFLRKPLHDMAELGRAIAGALARRAASLAGRDGGGEAPAPADAVGLTPRELMILRLVCEGLSNQDIADRLERREKTIRNQVSEIYAKIGVGTRTQAVRFCRERGLA